MAGQPSYIASGNSPRLTDTKLVLLAKKLGAIIGVTTTPNAAHNPRRTDTCRQLRVKIAKSSENIN